VALDRDDDRSPNEKQELARLLPNETGIADRNRAPQPRGDRREPREQHHVDGFGVGLAPHREAAGKLDQVSEERCRHHQLDRGEQACGSEEAGQPEIQGVTNEGRHRRVSLVLEAAIGRCERPQRRMAPRRQEIKRDQREVDLSQPRLEPHTSLPLLQAAAARGPRCV
jgi:hypothetical protein